MPVTRLDHWEDHPRRSGVIVLGGTDDELSRLIRARSPKADTDSGASLMDSVWASLRELVFEQRADGPRFTFVVTGLDPQTFELLASPIIQSCDLTAEDVKRTLARAVIEDIPVVANDPASATELARHQRALIVDGFTVDDAAPPRQFRLTAYPQDTESPKALLDALASRTLVSSGDLLHLRTLLEGEFSRHAEAARVLATIRASIEDLEALLTAPTRNEAALQSCLTRYPSLFGLEYSRVLPKHRLGAEYEMDYALEKISGVYDLAEIEASSLSLFTQSGDPRKELIHAEQQVLDWLRWIERNSAYARETLPGVQRPVGYVIIGRRPVETELRTRLQWRNTFFRGDLRILTYDDLLDGARSTLRVLSGAQAQPVASEEV